MLFSSMPFILVFLPAVMFLYFISPKQFRNFLLLVFSVIFYIWGEPDYLYILVSVILINYFGALLIDKFRKYKKIILIGSLILNLEVLIFFKYFNFLCTNIELLFHTYIDAAKVILPLGISFYIFQAMSYLIDVYKQECCVQKNLFKLSLFVCFFPQLIAGPIIKYHDFAPQLESRQENFDNVTKGIKRFITGLAKKVLIANTMGLIADKIFTQYPNELSTGVSWLGAFAYTFQIYFDFSGYSDMAIGLGLIFGFKFMENFNYPYISKSVTEFWRRWHMSLSGWFKQYVYIPLGGNRNGIKNTIRNLGIVFLLTGIWHGAAWNFILWGLWNGYFIIFEKLLNIKEFEQKKHSLIVRFIQHIYCIFVFVIGWVIFRAPDLNYALKYIKIMFGLSPAHPELQNYTIFYYIDLYEVLVFIIAIICSIPLFENTLCTKYIPKMKYVRNIFLIVLFILSVSMIASDTYNPFIYFRF